MLCIQFYSSVSNTRVLIRTYTRTANVVADHDDLLTQSRYIKMSKLSANIFLIRTTSNYFWSSVVGVVKVDYFDCSCKKIEKLVRIRCQGNSMQLLGFWNFFVFFRFFPLKLVYFETKSKKIIYGGFFHSFCVTDFNFYTKNNGRMK